MIAGSHQLAAQVKRLFDIRDRTYGIPPKTYEKCFVPSEAVEAMVKEGMAGDAADAVSLGNMLLNAGVFHHIPHAHPLADK